VEARLASPYNAPMASPQSPLQSATVLADDLTTVFGRRLQAVLMYGTHARPHVRPVLAPVQTLVLVDAVTYADLSACAERSAAWQARNLDMPLLLPSREFERSLDSFPLEYGDILAHHIMVRGDDPFAGLAVAAEDIRRACEIQARSHAIHLREGFLLAGHDAGEIARLIVASAGPLAVLLESFGRVTGAPRHATPDMIGAHAERVAGLSASLIGRLLALEEDATLDPSDATHLYPPYLDLVHALIGIVDTWRGDA
jgi:hypothetical protein